MNKEEYKETLSHRYPGTSEEVLELVWHFHDMEKARLCIKILGTCNSYADIACKAIRRLYVSCEIDSVKALSEKFISALLPFANLAKTANAHSVTYHVRKMLDDTNVKTERKAVEERVRQERMAQQLGCPVQTAEISIQIKFTTHNEELIRQVLLLASSDKSVEIEVKKKRERTVMIATAFLGKLHN